jgi:glycosyltransferase involved in cell wall biosynthesis
VRAVVHTEHGLRDHEPWYDPALKRWAARRSDVVVAVSTSLAAYLTGRVRVPATRVATLLNGVDTARFAPAPRDAAVRARLGVPAGVPLVGTVARLAPVKNQAMLLDAFAALLARVPDAHLVLAGDGELRGALEAQAARLRITARVHLPGALADTAPIYRELDAFVLCSFGEGTSISLLEAMATGVPSVATAVGGNPATVAHGEAGLLVPSGDTAALTEALARVLGEPAVGAALGAAARRHVLALYGEAAMADGYESVYRRALAPTSGG